MTTLWPRLPSGVQIEHVSAEALHVWGPRVAALERGARYPLGDDVFSIDHGADYFAFFRRLGRPSFYVAHRAGEVVAVGCVVHRSVPRAGRPPLCALYACDLKVAPPFRGLHLPVRLAWAGLAREYLRCPRGYGISMNKAGAPNRVARLMTHFPVVPVRSERLLDIYAMTFAEMSALLPALSATLGPIGFLDLSDKKALVLERTGRVMKILHVQHGPCAEPRSLHPEPDAVHMLCAVRGSRLAQLLQEMGVRPTADATILEHRMVGETDYGFLLTSDI